MLGFAHQLPSQTTGDRVQESQFLVQGSMHSAHQHTNPKRGLLHPWSALEKALFSERFPLMYYSTHCIYSKKNQI